MNFPTLRVNLDKIASNYSYLRSLGNKNCAAVVKANAYGLGVKQVAKTLFTNNCTEFFVATLAEGIELREILPTANIFVFHGVRQSEVAEFLHHSLMPVLNDLAQVEIWSEAGKYALHFDTGMCRLGLEFSDIKNLRISPNLQLIMSHLACANEPQNQKNAEQLELFRKITQYFPNIPASFANSSGVFLGQDYHFDLLRPGCSLYGISPNTTLPNPMQNVVTLSAPVLQYRRIEKDQTVGYGASAIIKKGSILATVEIGYADGFLRTLGNKINGYVKNIKTPLIGRVSMDMVSVDVTNVPEYLLSNNLRIEFINDIQPVDFIAETAQTIGYEIFTRIGSRVKRVYENI